MNAVHRNFGIGARIDHGHRKLIKQTYMKANPIQKSQKGRDELPSGDQLQSSQLIAGQNSGGRGGGGGGTSLPKGMIASPISFQYSFLCTLPPRFPRAEFEDCFMDFHFVYIMQGN